MTDIFQEVQDAISSAKSLPLEEQPGAFEAIRQKLESLIADSRSAETGSNQAE